MITQYVLLYFAIIYIILFEIRQFTTVLFYASLTFAGEKAKKKIQARMCNLCFFLTVIFLLFKYDIHNIQYIYDP